MDAERSRAAGNGRLDGELLELLDFATAEIGAPVHFAAEPGDGSATRTARAGGGVIVEGAHVVHGVLHVSERTGVEAHEERLLAAVARLVAGRLDRQVERAEALRARAERIRWVLDADALSVVFQPILDLHAARIVGVEALARFPDGVQPPERWFAEAAAVGLGRELEARAIAKATEVFAILPPDVYLSVNVSPAVAALPEIRRMLRNAPLDRLVFEITEHDQVADYEELNRTLRPLRRRGLRLAVDDAGAGFASLRHILRIHPDIIKLDMSLIRDIDRDAVLRALSYSISAFGAAVEASVVAEGIESKGELNALRFLGVSYGQGYLLQEPVAFEDLDLGRRALTRSRTG